MTDYRKLSKFQQKKVDKQIKKDVEPGPRVNEYNGFKWIEPDYTLDQVHIGNYCCDCLMIYYNCLCSHPD